VVGRSSKGILHSSSTCIDERINQVNTLKRGWCYTSKACEAGCLLVDDLDDQLPETGGRREFGINV
jgi:hypothetical protein